jgi:hypothetical protein
MGVHIVCAARRNPGDRPVIAPTGTIVGRPCEGGVMRGDTTAVGKQLAVVVEDDHAVAEQPPSLFRMERHEASRIMIGSVRGRTRRLMPTHRWTSIFAGLVMP